MVDGQDNGRRTGVRKGLRIGAYCCLAVGAIAVFYGAAYKPMFEPDPPPISIAEDLGIMETYKDEVRDLENTSRYLMFGGLALVLIGFGGVVLLGDSSSNFRRSEPKRKRRR